jgi:hypothetical protein
MRKLKLDSLVVESFETTSAESRPRGTVAAHIDEPCSTPSANCTIVSPYTYNNDCKKTEFFDCTFGCSLDTRCNRCEVYPLTHTCVK